MRLREEVKAILENEKNQLVKMTYPGDSVTKECEKAWIEVKEFLGDDAPGVCDENFNDYVYWEAIEQSVVKGADPLRCEGAWTLYEKEGVLFGLWEDAISGFDVRRSDVEKFLEFIPEEV